jgi:hypothetical protein
LQRTSRSSYRDRKKRCPRRDGTSARRSFRIQLPGTIERLPLIEAIPVDALLARDRSERRAIVQRQLNDTTLFRERQATTGAALIRSFRSWHEDLAT